MIDARGRSCPEPVIMVKKALATKEKEYTMLVDNPTSVENVTRFAEHNGYSVVSTEDGEDYKLTITKK
jgi:TusA-related sulfurtransferase